MKRILLLLFIPSLVACSGDSRSKPPSSIETASESVDQAVAGNDTVLTDQRKAAITDAFLEFNAKDMLKLKKDDCATLENSMQLFKAKQIIYDRFPGAISPSPDINELISLLGTRIQELSCTGSKEPDVTTVDVKTSGGQSTYKMQIPT